MFVGLLSLDFCIVGIGCGFKILNIGVKKLGGELNELIIKKSELLYAVLRIQIQIRSVGTVCFWASWSRIRIH
jgi:hypothetical protein